MDRGGWVARLRLLLSCHIKNGAGVPAGMQEEGADTSEILTITYSLELPGHLTARLMAPGFVRFKDMLLALGREW